MRCNVAFSASSPVRSGAALPRLASSPIWGLSRPYSQWISLSPSPFPLPPLSLVCAHMHAHAQCTYELLHVQIWEEDRLDDEMEMDIGELRLLADSKPGTSREVSRFRTRLDQTCLDSGCVFLCVCVCVCARARVRACVRACVRECVCVCAWILTSLRSL